MYEPTPAQDYEDLIYTRVDLPQPPVVDEARLARWVIGPDRTGMIEELLHKPSSSSASYPWKAVIACKNNKWDSVFAAEFPELVAYAELFPTKLWRQVSIIAQLPGQKVFLHTDPDKVLGWRVYLTHGGPRLYFQKFKKRWDSRPKTWSMGGPNGMAELCQGERIYVQDKGCYPWMLTATRAAHGVSDNHGVLGSRVTMLLFPEPEFVDQEKHNELIGRSVAKYADTAIWY